MQMVLQRKEDIEPRIFESDVKQWLISQKKENKEDDWTKVRI